MSSGYNPKNLNLVNSQVSAAITSTVLSAANSNRTYLFIQNQGGTDLTVTFDGQVPVVGTLGVLLPAGATYEPKFAPTGPVLGISTTSANLVNIVIGG